MSTSTTILLGDAVDVFKDVRGLNAIVSDPPGGGAFMGLKFDRHHGGRDKWIAYWTERFKVAREATERGSWGLFWGFGKTAHWTACALDDAGWEYVRPIGHLYGQGWPKARSQLKPSWEIWHLVRWGSTSALQIDRCRVRSGRSAQSKINRGGSNLYNHGRGMTGGHLYKPNELGSWPTDAILSHCPACREVGSRRVRGSGPASGPTLVGGSVSRSRGRMNGTTNPPAFYGKEQEAPAWECLAACSCGLASLSPAGGEPSHCPGCAEERWWACPVAELDRQSDGGSRFFPTFGGGVSTLYCPSCLDVNLRGGPSTSAMADGIESGVNLGAANSYSNSKVDGFGSERTGLSPKGARSTTKTRTQPTTGSKTSNASPVPSMTPNMLSRCPTCGAPMVRWSDAAASAMSGNQWPSSSQDPQGHSKDTANRAALSHSANGGPRTPSIGRHTGEHGMPWGYQPSFHYDAKASKYERQAGCEGDDFLWLRDKSMPIGWRRVTSAEFDAAQVPNDDKGTGNIHSTVKPVGAGDDDGLMRWLVRLITPPGGRVGDITIGSGSTAIAAQIESHAFVGCDIDPGAVHIAQARCAYWTPERHREELAGTIARREAVRKKAEAERAAAEARGQLDIFGAKR